MYKNNLFFNENPTALKLILYQDGFQIVNPIGPSRKKHKILAVYLSIGNLPYDIRSNLKNIQLVALCPEKQFSHEIVYGTIVSDLQKIENGIEIQPDEFVQGSIILECSRCRKFVIKWEFRYKIENFLKAFKKRKISYKVESGKWKI